MKSIGEIMAELGFNPKGSTEVQKAFIKHLINQANVNAPKTQEFPKTKPVLEPEQLSFDFDDTKKVS